MVLEMKAVRLYIREEGGQGGGNQTEMKGNFTVLHAVNKTVQARRYDQSLNVKIYKIDINERSQNRNT